MFLDREVNLKKLTTLPMLMNTFDEIPVRYSTYVLNREADSGRKLNKDILEKLKKIYAVSGN